jgi:sialate O-acetylesterase
MIKRFTITLTTLFFGLTLQAKIVLPPILSSNMVLQQNSTVTIWGWADAGEKVSLTASWSSKTFKTKATEEGTWAIQIATTDSRSPKTINIKGKDHDITLSNILFGEVWLCSGQSNMRQSLKGYKGQPTFGGNMAIAKSRNYNLRLFTINESASLEPADTIGSHVGWAESSPSVSRDFSAVAYYFGQQLQEILDVPVGIILSSWGGSSVEAWISRDVLGEMNEVDLDHLELGNRNNQVPTALFNAMIHPITNYNIKGALWYQGESNRHNPDAYTRLFPAMVKDWRQRWQLGNFPFYYVQIAPFGYNDTNSAFIREAQQKCLDLIPESGMAVTLDLGEEACIHPARKKEVADRLLFLALNNTYDMPQVDCYGPIYFDAQVSNAKVVLSFSHAEMGLYARQKELNGFELCGEDGEYMPASARIINRTQVEVWNDSIPHPAGVRYGWSNWPEPSLFDTNLLPAPSFRTTLTDN